MPEYRKAAIHLQQIDKQVVVSVSNKEAQQ